MKPDKFFYIVGIIFLIFTMVPGIALSELKPLDDADLSKVEAQSGVTDNEKGLRTDGRPGELSECVTGEDGFCGVNDASTCSTGSDCFNNEPFAANFPNPTQTFYINQGPSCRSGGCGK